MGSHLRNDKLLLKISCQLKELRSLKGVTQEDVYNDTGVHISRIETGKINLTVSTLEHLCTYFDINMSEIFKMMENNKS